MINFKTILSLMVKHNLSPSDFINFKLSSESQGLLLECDAGLFDLETASAELEKGDNDENILVLHLDLTPADIE